MMLTFREELCVITMKNDAKSQEESTCCFKIGVRNVTNFDLQNQDSQKFTF